MKLYTEEQVKGIMSKVFAEGVCFGASPIIRNKPFDEILQDFNPIELPIDEEIHKQSCEFYPIKDSLNEMIVRDNWVYGAKWVLDKIKNQKQ